MNTVSNQAWQNVIARKLFSLGIALFLTVVVIATGCRTSQPVPPSSADPIRIDQVEYYVDWSLSAGGKELTQCNQALLALLPELVAEYQVTSFSAYQFREDGWRAGSLGSVEFLPVTAMANDEVTNLVGSIKHGLEHKARLERQRQAKEKLSQLNAERFSPPADLAPATCTDLKGVLKRIAYTGAENEVKRRLTIIATDGKESCRAREKLNKVTLSPSHAVVIVLLPEGTTGLHPDVEFEHQATGLAQALPDAVVIPYFKGLQQAVRDAVSKSVPSGNKLEVMKARAN